MSDQALHTNLVLGNAAVLWTASTVDSNAERSSLLHLNQGRLAGIKAHRGLAGCLDTPGTCTMSLGCGLFRQGCGLRPVEVNFRIQQAPGREPQRMKIKLDTHPVNTFFKH